MRRLSPDKAWELTHRRNILFAELSVVIFLLIINLIYSAGDSGYISKYILFQTLHRNTAYYTLVNFSGKYVHYKY